MFKWAAAVSLSLEKRLPVALPLLLPPLVREMTDAAAPLQLKTLATEVGLRTPRSAAEPARCGRVED